MRSMQFRFLMESLDSALDNDRDFIEETSPEGILEDMKDNLDMDPLWDVKDEEILTCIRQWKERHFEN